MASKFELFNDADGKFRFRLKAPNGTTIATSEGYESKAEAERIIRLVRLNAPRATKVDRTEPVVVQKKLIEELERRVTVAEAEWQTARTAYTQAKLNRISPNKAVRPSEATLARCKEAEKACDGALKVLVADLERAKLQFKALSEESSH
jgi:uncharacterized protein